MKKILSNTIITLLFILIGLVLMEGGSRLILYDSLSLKKNTVREGDFFKEDPVTGWAHIPNLKKTFFNSSVGFNAYVTINEYGLRNNANEFNNELQNAPVILILGDSITAAFEVDDNQTYTAQLEKILFESNCKYRVYNAGVRGYGTDQSYWNLLRLSKILKPDITIYMFTYNDILNNRTIKRLRRRFGKPAYGLKDGSLELIKPEKGEFERSYYAYVKNDTSGYEVVSGHSMGSIVHIGFFIRENFAIYNFLFPIYTLLLDKRKELESEGETHMETEIMILKILLHRMKLASSRFYLTEHTSQLPNHRLTNLIDLNRELGIEYIDLYSYFTNPYSKYIWKRDRNHWNELGHRTAAVGLFNELREEICVNPT